jgi:cell division septation protein DedD
MGHTWQGATYDAPKTCTICSETEGEALERPKEPAVEEEEPVDGEKVETISPESPSAEPEELPELEENPGWFARLISAIVNFFKKLFKIN